MTNTPKRRLRLRVPPLPTLCLLLCAPWIYSFPQKIRSHVTRQRWIPPLRATGDDDDDSSSLNDLRRALERAWDKEAMGEVPTTPELAAEAAAVAVRNALAQNVLSMVDILLPQYDANQSDKVYDEVLAVEFCVCLAQKLDTSQTSIVVRDNRIVQTVSRILDRREEAMMEVAAAAQDEEDDLDDDENETDLLSSDSPVSDGSKDDIDSFRAKLSAEWNLDETTVAPTKPNRPPSNPDRPLTPQVNPQSKTKASPTRRYRLCSMLGDAVGIRSGPDMQRDVIEAVKANALPQPDEETMIILSAATPQELVGIRALVCQYEATKKIVLVNCRTDPLPRELSKAQTVYSILPLVAKPTEKSSSVSKQRAKPAPRIVVLRRFPRDWEIFVDTGAGFERAATLPAVPAQPKGPAMSWIVQAVSRYLSMRSSR